MVIANKFNEYFIGIGPKLAEQIPVIQGKKYEDYLTDPKQSIFKFVPMSEEDIYKIVKSLNTKTSYGFDGISTKLLQRIISPILKPLTLVINQSLATGIYPEKLKIAKICPLYKKGNVHVIDNYRPISLLPSLSKVFEKAVFNQLYSYFKEYDLFFDSQYGFLKLHSTQHAALELVDYATHEIDQNSAALSVYLDLSKAFDTIDQNILLHKLRYYGVSNTELIWFKNYLENRSQFVEIDGFTSDVLGIHTGVPQGSILGPLLFIIYINDLPHCTQFFKFIIYADDTSLFSSLNIADRSVSIHDTFTLLNMELDKVSKWMALNKSLNISKTKYIISQSKRKTCKNNFSVYIDGTSIERVSNFIFL